jgi:hypothetical protein
MDKAELKALWTLRLRGLAAVNARVAQERTSATTDELLARADRVFMQGGAKRDKEEQRVRAIWIEWRRRATAADLAASHS